MALQAEVFTPRRDSDRRNSIDLYYDPTLQQVNPKPV